MRIAPILLAAATGIALIAAIAFLAIHPTARPVATPKAIIGTRDEVYYSHAATKPNAESLGRALIAAGFLTDRGTTVLLDKSPAGTIVSFVLEPGAEHHPKTVLAMEELGRRVAPAIGGLPIKIRLIDSSRVIHKELNVGRTIAGTRDEVYYYGAATEPQAAALGRALQAAGYFTNSGSSVILSKDAITVISFVLDDGAAQRPQTVPGFDHLVRQIAPSAGGLPLEIHLLNPRMETQKQWTVQ